MHARPMGANGMLRKVRDAASFKGLRGLQRLRFAFSMRLTPSQSNRTNLKFEVGITAEE